ncbi:unnamed protein product [Phytophthora fragariaefolia]|uniref:Unnamed protein product n=1 Tax=Phytophthora fragariaefolia TaxID=1490495 RepID=A0A9W6TK31_9STRA|nr:unnamed protein product [Phytophthora fragariaefolia]
MAERPLPPGRAAGESEFVWRTHTFYKLPPETLHAGDTIRYYSMAFGCGDASGERVSKVLKIAQHADEDDPTRGNTQERIPPTMLIKRVLNRFGNAFRDDFSKWRKLRTEDVVPRVSAKDTGFAPGICVVDWCSSDSDDGAGDQEADTGAALEDNHAQLEDNVKPEPTLDEPDAANQGFLQISTHA